MDGRKDDVICDGGIGFFARVEWSGVEWVGWTFDSNLLY